MLEAEVCLDFHSPSTMVISPGGGFQQVARQRDPLDIEQIKFKPWAHHGPEAAA
jgi:hypothetical protein